MQAATASHTLDDLCALTGLPRRTVRYYMQLGLVDRPEGETRAARYGSKQIEQLLQIRKWSAAGLSLDRIRALLLGELPQVQAPPFHAGMVTVRSHMAVAPGITLVIEPHVAGLSPEAMRAFSGGVIELLAQVLAAEESPQ
jgi:DNA-binding transcriptional MerR regulator